MLNQVNLIGRVGKDPEIKYLPSGDAVANFSVATTEKWKDKNTGERKEATEWHRCNAFGRLAEIIGEYVGQGDLLFVGGRISTRKYQKDGVDHYATEIKCDEMKMLSSKRNDGDGGQNTQRQQRPTQRPAQRPAAGGQQQRPAQRQASSGFEDMDDDIPFADPMKRRAFALSI